MAVQTIIYQSTAAQPLSPAELDTLVAQARHHNAANGITGRLAYRDQRFWQLIEGPPPAIASLYDAIKHDPRHHDIIELSAFEVPNRAFTYWALDQAADPDSAGTAGATSGAIESAAAAIPASWGLRHVPIQHRSETTVARLLDTAAALIERNREQLLDQVTLRELADLSNVGIKSAYRYFSTPGDVFRAYVARQTARRRAEMSIRLKGIHIASDVDGARQFARSATQMFSAYPRLSPKQLRYVVRHYFVINCDALWQDAEDAEAALVREGIISANADSRAYLAAGLGAVAGVFKITTMHRPTMLTTPAFEKLIADIFLLSLRAARGAAPDPGASGVVTPPTP